MSEAGSPDIRRESGTTVTAVLLCLLVGAEIANVSGVVGDRFGVSVYLGLLGLTTVSLIVGIATHRVTLRFTPVVTLLAVLVGLQAPAVLFAEDREVAFAAFVGLLKDAWFLAVVVLLAGSLISVWTLAKLVVAPMAALAGMALVSEFVFGGAMSFGGFSVVSTSLGEGTATARYAGPFEDPNFWGRLLVMVVPVAMSLVARAARTPSPWAVAGWSTSVVLLLGGVYLTQSRGALVGLGVGVLIWMALVSRKSRRSILALPVLFLVVAAIPGIGSRLATLAELSDVTTGQGDYSLVERTAAQQIALAMFVDNVAVGVGPENFQLAWGDYNDRADIVVRRSVAPHNLYLQLAAEGGLLGLFGWVVFYGGVMVLAMRVIVASPTNRGGPAPPERLLAVGVLSGLAAWGVSSVFLHLSYFRPLLVLMVLVAVLHDRLRLEDRPEVVMEMPGRRPSPRRRRLTVAVAACAMLLAGFLVVDPGPRTWVASVQIVMVPPGSENRSDRAYSYDLLGRSEVMPTFAAVVQRIGAPLVEDGRLSGGDSEALDVNVSGTSSQAVVTVDVHGSSPVETLRVAREIAQRGADYVNSTPSLSELARAGVGPASVQPAS